MKVIDLRSDTLTTPTEEMLKCMLAAKLGDDGRLNGEKGEDPTAIQLETLAAKKFGKEDALFVPSGTMGNLVSVMANANRGDSIVVTQNAHIYKNERGVFDNNLCGFVPVFVDHTKGVYDLDQLESRLKSKKIAVVCIENTSNAEGGTVMSKEQTNAITDLCKKYNVPVHLDGARIFNAAFALGISVEDLTANIDSVMFCLSKGLCAPVGSVVVGSKEFIKKARDRRKLLGGQMRQIGGLAAAGIVSIEKMTDRLTEDHERARRLAEGLSQISGLKVDLARVQTNIIRVDIAFRDLDGASFVTGLSERYKVKGNLVAEKTLRFVIYNGITDSDIDETILRIEDYCNKQNK